MYYEQQLNENSDDDEDLDMHHASRQPHRDPITLRSTGASLAENQPGVIRWTQAPAWRSMGPTENDDWVGVTSVRLAATEEVTRQKWRFL